MDGDAEAGTDAPENADGGASEKSQDRREILAGGKV
jgi:hypothetical protein